MTMQDAQAQNIARFYCCRKNDRCYWYETNVWQCNYGV